MPLMNSIDGIPTTLPPVILLLVIDNVVVLVVSLYKLISPEAFITFAVIVPALVMV